MRSNDKVLQEFRDLLSFNSEEELVTREQNVIHFQFMSGLEEIMKQLKISRKKLAEAVGVSASYITQLFRGTKMINIEMLAKIKLALEIEYEIECVQSIQKENTLRKNWLTYHRNRSACRELSFEKLSIRKGTLKIA